MKRCAYIAIVCICVLITARAGGLQTIVARIDDAVITEQEFRLSLAALLPAHSGRETVNAFLATALDHAIDAKIRLMLACESGLLDDVSYEGFLQALHRENTVRRLAKDQGGVVFGPLAFSESAFFSYRLAHLELLVKQRLVLQTYNEQNHTLADQIFAQKIKERRATAKVEVEPSAAQAIFNMTMGIE